jgi:hypothetical protein
MYTTSASHALGGEFMGEAGNFYDGWNLQFVNHIAGIKGLLTLSTKTSFSAFIQYNTAISKFVTNIRLRWNPREGNDFYIVYNEGLNSNIRREVPYLPYSIGRTVLLKYTYTFRLQKH